VKRRHIKITYLLTAPEPARGKGIRYKTAEDDGGGSLISLYEVARSSGKRLPNRRVCVHCIPVNETFKRGTESKALAPDVDGFHDAGVPELLSHQALLQQVRALALVRINTSRCTGRQPTTVIHAEQLALCRETGFKVLSPTRRKLGHSGDVPQAKLLAWYRKTKLNTTKAHIHQSKEMYYNTK